ncbi:MAG: Nif3-like dinuclear metal center hexameric protein [Firmicutes bacterium]|nr:Nif3-like dinuclear metal center hexameric protein [Candidatus Caballimonas caccae]
MYNIDNVFSVLDKYAPLSLSKKMIESGEYDNSGILIKDHDEVKGVLFTLDLSILSVKKAKRLKCDTIVTHHPAIYTPLKNLSKDSSLSSPVLFAIKNKINVISMHLNLDVANGGIDQCLCEGLGAKKWKILSYLDEEHGYGREFNIKDIKFYEYLKQIEKEFNTNKLISYGSRRSIVKNVASFCGAGGSYAEKEVLNNTLKADTIITSDLQHHDIKYFIESGKKIIVIPHYVSENYGFKKYYERCAKELKVNSHYFDDKRFW